MNASLSPSMPWPADCRRPYDLATEVADYQDWIGVPHRTILICTHPRSGSTLLGEAFYFAGNLGCPLEYFHRGFRPSLAQRWQAEEIHSFLQAVYRHRTDPTGVLSVKLFWRDVLDLVGEMVPLDFKSPQDVPAAVVAPQTYRRIRELFGEIFPNPTFIYLTRQDRIRQAVSALMAAQTRLWRSIPNVGEQSPQKDAAYDYDQILGFLAFSDHCNAHWRNFFLAAGDPYHGIVYEDLADNYLPTLSGLFERLGCSGPLPPPRMHRQADARSERMVSRFLREHTERMVTLANPDSNSGIQSPDCTTH
jgi:trehalose 2-sulfotransferase